ncbi:MAG: helix-turn-helix transcriptional regulator [Aeriscardovia sp.]|nr:helix-turn-helix transcriptional regulator [Aeriscardovia sp.]
MVKPSDQEPSPLTPSQATAVRLYRKQLDLAQQLRKQYEERKSLAGREPMRPMQKRLMRAASENGLTENSILFREVLGEVIRSLRTERKETLHDMAEKTGVSLGYLSEVERGKKEASSEVMESISTALGLRLSDTLRLVATALDLNETDRREVLKSGMLRK